jgi:hypothetical protein
MIIKVKVLTKDKHKLYFYLFISLSFLSFFLIILLSLGPFNRRIILILDGRFEGRLTRKRIRTNLIAA